MTGAIVALIVLDVIASVALIVMVSRSAHYIRTGRWFR